jgi:cell division protein FtsB
MRIRRSVTRFLGATVIPAISIAVAAYFGVYAIDGQRGYLALRHVNSQLSTDGAKLAALQDENARLKHRIDLLQPGHVDPDLVEELARGQLLSSAPNQIAVPRERH